MPLHCLFVFLFACLLRLNEYILHICIPLLCLFVNLFTCLFVLFVRLFSATQSVWHICMPLLGQSRNGSNNVCSGEGGSSLLLLLLVLLLLLLLLVSLLLRSGSTGKQLTLISASRRPTTRWRKVRWRIRPMGRPTARQCWPNRRLGWSWQWGSCFSPVCSEDCLQAPAFTEVGSARFCHRLGLPLNLSVMWLARISWQPI